MTLNDRPRRPSHLLATPANQQTLKATLQLLMLLGGLLLLGACQKQQEHTAAAVRDRDSVSMMTTYGVNTLISDSGVIKYRIITERWEVNQVREPSRWIFEKGLFFEQFDEKFHVQSYIQCDTAYYYDQERLWELHGRVSVLTKDGLRFNSELLFWDQAGHELYSYKPSKLVTPERTLEGTYFRSDERMTNYYVSNSRGSFEQADIAGEGDTLTAQPDTVKAAIRPQKQPQRKTVQQP